MLKKLTALLLALMMLLGCTAAFAETEEHAPVTISYYSTQAGVDDETVATLKAFMEQYPWITVNYYPCGDDQLAAWLGLYNGGNAPTVALLDCGQILNYSDYLVDLTQVEDPSFFDHVLSGTQFFQKEGDTAIYGIPASYQGFSLMVNKTVVKKVFGDDFDFDSVNTVDKLVAFFDGLEAAGYPATVVFSADWALGAHYLGCQLFSEWLGDKETQRQLMADLKDGKGGLIDNEHFNNLMDVFDILMKYNINKADPLADTQEGDLELLAHGKVATMFQGDWNWLVLHTYENLDELAIMPLPLTNDENDPRNAKILGSCPKGYAVDKFQNTPEQQAAGVLLAQWLALSPEGEDFMVSLIGSTLPFDNVTAVNENPLAVSTQKFLNEERILDCSTYLCEAPSDFWLVCGPFMQAYLAGQMDRATLAEEIGEYFADLD
jgi:raffinose/stachyose/melibiose transport system substrate-binding protein